MADHGKRRTEMTESAAKSTRAIPPAESKRAKPPELLEETIPPVSEEEKGDGLRMDPLGVLGPEILMSVMEMLDARSAVRSALVSRGWKEVATSDYLWAPMCEKLWKGKAHIPRSSKFRGANKFAAYSMSMMDGKRTRIMKEDLCDHAWEFHFKKSAPEYWLNLDPSLKGTGPLMRRYFHPDGSQTADPDDRVWGGHECSFSIITSYAGKDGRVRSHYVRINRWPPMTISRREDWSWEMANNFYCYNSVPDAEKGRTGPLFPRW